MRVRQELHRQAAYWKLVPFEVFIVLVLGCLFLNSLVRARRCWRNKASRHTFLMELEAQDPTSSRWTGVARLDSHAMFISGVPRVVGLLYLLARETYVWWQALLLIASLGMSLLTVVQAVLNFDYHASRYIRRQYDLSQSPRFQAGSTPKLLDGLKAHAVVCPPDIGPLSEDYLETMWHAAEELLEPDGVMLPSALLVRAMPLEWWPLGQRAGALHAELAAGYTLNSTPSDGATPLCHESSAMMRVDLAERQDGLPSGEVSITMDKAGTLTAIAFWNEAVLGECRAPATAAGDTALPPHFNVAVLQAPRQVADGDTVRVAAALVGSQLALNFPVL